LDENKFTVTVFSLNHRIECWGFLFRQKKKPRSIDPIKIKKFNIPASFYPKLQNGEDYTNAEGAIIANEWVTIANVQSKSYAYCADTIYDERLIEIVKEVDLLYHETTYLNSSAEKAAARFHCTTSQAANIALKAKVKRLIIGHFSSKYEHLEDFLTETTEIFKDTELSKEGTCYFIL
jgi:ribonuclease Z